MASPLTQGPGGHEEETTYKDYFDIMLLGKTGMGKTTTADKLLVANPTNAKYDYNPMEDTRARTRGTTPSDSRPPGTSDNCRESRQSRDLELNVSKDSTSIIESATKYSDLTMWHLSENQDMKEIEERLKNLVMWRQLDSSHKLINESRENSQSSASCELLSNDTSKLRVLDVPGFYGPNAAADIATEKNPGNVFERTSAALENDLATMRKILHIKVATHFKFNRIVYFLPDTGVLTRPSQYLQTEIGIMARYFERTIFKSMVVVATHDHSIYKKVRDDCDLYTAIELEQTCAVFQEAMKKVFQTEVPNPPIVFISQLDSCDNILRKIKQSKVIQEGAWLTFNPSTCARCGIHIGRLTSPRQAKASEVQDNIAICTNKAGTVAVPYDESTCHPMLVPKYHKAWCILGGIAHLLTLKMFINHWPYFGNEDEVCIDCRNPPKSRGCVKVGSKYQNKKVKGDGILVKHTSEVEENYKFVLDMSDSVMRIDYSEMNTGPAATAGTEGTLQFIEGNNIQ